jgi:hypothetical protein
VEELMAEKKEKKATTGTAKKGCGTKKTTEKKTGKK